MTKQFWKKIRSNTIWKGFQLLSVFLLNVAIARVFKAEGSGDFLFLLANFQLAATIASLSIESGIQYYGTGDHSLLGGLSRFIFRYTGWLTLLLLALLPLFLSFHLISPSLNPVLFSVYALGFITGTILFKFFSVIGYAVRSFILPTALETAGNGGLLICLWVLNSFHPAWGRSLFFGLFYIMPLINGALLILYLRKKYATLFKETAHSPVHFPSLFRYSGMAFLANVVFFGVYRIDYWFVAFYCSPRELGNYIQASRLGQLFFHFPQLIALIIFPDVVQGVAFTSRAAILKLMASIAGVYTLCILVFLVVGKTGLLWILGPSFDLVYPAFLRLFPGIFALGPLTVLSAYFAGRNEVVINLKGGLVALLLMLTGDLLFIPRYHIMGAAWVSSVAYVGYFIYGYTVFSIRSPKEGIQAAPI